MNNSYDFNRVSKVLILVFVLSFVFNYFIASIATGIFSPIQSFQYNTTVHVTTIISYVISYSLNLVLGIFLYRRASDNKWAWLLLSLVFGFQAVLLYFIIDISKSLKKEN